MSRVLTGDKLIESVRNRTMTPDDTSIFTDQDILDVTNEELDVQILDKLLSLHEEHLTVKIDIPRNNSGSYDIPYRSIGNKVRDVSLQSGGQTYELAQISIGELSDYRKDESSGGLDKFYVESNQIKIINPNRSYDNLRVWYYIRPSVLTKVEEAGVISSIVTDENAGTVTLVLSTVGKNFVASVDYDIVGKRTPNKIKGYDLLPISVTTGASGSIVFNLSDVESFVSEIIVGDYVTLAEQTPVPNIPTELHPVLAQAGAVHILEALGDTEGLNNAQKRLDNMTKSVQVLVDDRVELAPKKIKSRHGTLQQAMGRGRRGNGKGSR